MPSSMTNWCLRVLRAISLSAIYLSQLPTMSFVYYLACYAGLLLPPSIPSAFYADISPRVVLIRGDAITAFLLLFASDSIRHRLPRAARFLVLSCIVCRCPSLSSFTSASDADTAPQSRHSRWLFCTRRYPAEFVSCARRFQRRVSFSFFVPCSQHQL